MTNLEQPQNDEREFSPESLLESLKTMPEGTIAEIYEKRDAYNKAILTLETQFNTIALHNETESDSAEDNSQEETESGRDRSILLSAIQECRMKMGELHDRIVGMEQK